MGQIAIILAVLLVATEAAGWISENSRGQPGNGGKGTIIESTMTRIASGDITPSVAPTTAETTEPTPSPESAAPTVPAPSTESATPVEPADEEQRPKTNVGASQPPLNLAELEKRIRETDALGFFTKLSLKNQVDSLLSRFNAYHKGKSDLSIAQLRERYNLLLLKLVSLLEDDDAQLSHDIFTSREAIWKVLVDPEQFAQLQES
ncbi:MAG: hypothetical protein AB7G75_07850 [Candidatus Binatia bacterium]